VAKCKDGQVAIHVQEFDEHEKISKKYIKRTNSNAMLFNIVRLILYHKYFNELVDC
jgi:hypothetical protein